MAENPNPRVAKKLKEDTELKTKLAEQEGQEEKRKKVPPTHFCNTYLVFIWLSAAPGGSSDAGSQLAATGAGRDRKIVRS